MTKRIPKVVPAPTVPFSHRLLQVFRHKHLIMLCIRHVGPYGARGKAQFAWSALTRQECELSLRLFLDDDNTPIAALRAVTDDMMVIVAKEMAKTITILRGSLRDPAESVTEGEGCGGDAVLDRHVP